MNRGLTEEQAAFLDGIAREYEKMLFRYCAKCVSYNPKIMPIIPDLIQEVYLKASLNADALMRHENIPGWLKKSCHFSLLNMLRKHSASREIPYPAMEKLQQLFGREEEPAVTLEEVTAAAEQILTDDEQAIFNDYFLDDLSAGETARLNHLTYDTVRGRISRIRRKLKKHFGRDA